MDKEKPFVCSNGMLVDDAFWANIKDREPTPEEYQAIREWRNAVNIQGLLMMYGADGKKYLP